MITPATTIKQLTSQETDWPDAIPVQIPWVSSSTAQPEEQEISRGQARYNSDSFEIPELEDNSEEEQFANLESYLAHHNTYEASQHICDAARVWGRPKATEHTKECLLPRRLGCLLI